jgi:S1-C subfamily serine protease
MENRFNDLTQRARLERRSAPALALLPLLIGLGLFAPAFGQQAPQQPQISDQQAQPTQIFEKPSEAIGPAQTASSPSEISRAFINAAKRVKPSVVHINVGTRGANGSGVIVSPDGYILTNNHVASAAYELRVKLSDGRQLTARRIGVDSRTDLALIKVEAQNLPSATLGDSSKLEQGEWVIALGSPFGLEQTMTAGIVSAIGRKFGGPYDNFIQTDASINPGNSGGALVNMNGEVIGINTSIYSKGGGSEGVGFSIPSNIAKQVKDNLLRNSRTSRGYLGSSR